MNNYSLICACVTVSSIHEGTNGKRKRDEESSESEEEETEVTTPKNKKATTTPQTFPKASKKVRNSNEACSRRANLKKKKKFSITSLSGDLPS